MSRGGRGGGQSGGWYPQRSRDDDDPISLAPKKTGVKPLYPEREIPPPVFEDEPQEESLYRSSLLMKHRQMTERYDKSPFHMKNSKVSKSNDIQRYSDQYFKVSKKVSILQIISKPCFPEELLKGGKRSRRLQSQAEEIDPTKIEALEKRERERGGKDDDDDDEEEPKQKKPKTKGEGEEGEDDDEEEDDEDEDDFDDELEGDYGMSYFDNGEEYLEKDSGDEAEPAD
eukprot:GFYU01022051.1.p1 GENE.GFYU01022051.1~~GFYU01022051.1.p1  ORF type:complete len:228 (-),score=48.74 GFYU01022051.1:149-832(-)